MYDQACKYLGIWFLEIFLVAFNSVENILQKFTTLPFNIIYKQTKKNYNEALYKRWIQEMWLWIIDKKYTAMCIFQHPWRISYEVHLHTYILRRKHSEYAHAFRCCTT